jgi:hypothetical protein
MSSSVSTTSAAGGTRAVTAAWHAKHGHRYTIAPHPRHRRNCSASKSAGPLSTGKSASFTGSTASCGSSSIRAIVHSDNPISRAISTCRFPAASALLTANNSSTVNFRDITPSPSQALAPIPQSALCNPYLLPAQGPELRVQTGMSESTLPGGAQSPSIRRKNAEPRTPNPEPFNNNSSKLLHAHLQYPLNRLPSFPPKHLPTSAFQIRNLQSPICNRPPSPHPMSKRKTSKRPSRLPRKQPYSGPRVEIVVERVRDQAARLSSLARSMQDARLDQVVIDGHAMLLRGLNQIDNFIDNATRAVREAKTAKQGF